MKKLLWTSEPFKSEEAAKAAAASYERCYPPQGYGTNTRVVETPSVSGWIALGSRWSSCD